jgi:AcrR family transcriptional regulator
MAATATTTQLKATDPRVKRTRQLLLSAFTELLKEKSISSISVQDIAERATVNRATFYAHFEDKYALMHSWIREEFQQDLSRKVAVASTLTVENLRVLIVSVFEFLGGFYSTCRWSDTQFEPMFETAMQQELCGMLVTWLRQERSSEARLEKQETAAQAISWAIFGSAVQWSRGPRTRSAEEMSRDVLAVVTKGLSGVVGAVS